MSEQAAQTTNSAEQTTTEVAPAVEKTEAPVAEKPQESMVTTEEKPVEAAPAAEEKKPEAKPEEAKPAIPEKYELKLPEGSKLGGEQLAKIEALAKEKGWSQERAQEAVDERNAWQVEREQAQAQEIQRLNDKIWLEELKKDPDIGGTKFEESGHIAFKAAERFGGKEFADQLKQLKLNHHPQLFKFLVSVGRSMESDKIVMGATNTKGAGTRPEQRMYPDSPEFKSKEQ